MVKTKVIEIDVAKLDPNSVHLIVFSTLMLKSVQMREIVKQLNGLGIKAAYAQALDPQAALKVYEIPKEQK